MDGHWNLLFDGIGSWHFIGHFDDFFDLIRHVLDHWVGLWYLDFHGHMDVLLNGHMHDLLDRHWHGNLLDHCQCLFLVHREVGHMVVVVVLVVVQTALGLGGVLAGRCLGFWLDLFLLGRGGSLLVLSPDVAGGQQQDQGQRCRCAL